MGQAMGLASKELSRLDELLLVGPTLVVALEKITE